MTLASTLVSGPRAHLLACRPDHPVLYFAPAVLQATARRFAAGFPGRVTYAVKANDSGAILENLIAAGMDTFDVASPHEMRRVRHLLPAARLHYNNPVRSEAEISAAVALGVASYAVDSRTEFEKLLRAGVPAGTEVAVRLRLPVAGAAYDFGAKFGADPDAATELLAMVAGAGFAPAMTFHPGTQCAAPAAWATYIAECAAVAKRAGVEIGRLNVGGGFAAHRTGPAPDLDAIFEGIRDATARAFGSARPALVCEPGRAMVADSLSLAARVKAVRDDGALFLNDGIYGCLSESPTIGNVDRIEVVSPAGPRVADPSERVVFGPTCDSLDRLPGTLALPADLAEGDWLLFHGLGAYSSATVTRFNGYGAIEVITVKSLH